MSVTKAWEFQEKFDVTSANHIIRHQSSYDSNDIRMIQEFLKRGRINDQNYVTVVYSYDELGGRFHSVVKGKNGRGIVHYNNMKRELRAILGFKIYHDIDMVNSSPNFALQLFKKNNLNVTLLQAYIEFREEYLQLVCDTCNVNREAAKNLFIRISFYGSAEKWCKEHSIASEELPPFVIDLQKEFRSNVSHILPLHPDLLKYQQERKPQSKNPQGSQFSFLLQTIERTCLHNLVEAIHLDGFTIGSLIHDGLLVERLETCVYPATLENSNYFLGKWEKYVFEKTKYHIELCEKELVVDDVVVDTDVVLDSVIATDDDEASDAFLSVHKDNIKKSEDGRMFLRLDSGIWTCNKSIIEQEFLLMCLKMNIVDHNGNSYSKKVSKTSGITRAVVAKVERDDSFLTDLWHSNLGYLCYRNGYWNFKDHKFIPWGLNDPVMSTMCIKRDFVQERNEEIIQQVEKRLWESILPDIEVRTFFKKYLARAMAGHVEEKCWNVCIGQRNTGKGCLISFLQNAFGCYIQTVGAENFLLKGGVSDNAKSQSWMLDHEFTRLAVSNEFTLEDDKGRRLKINGNAIKRFASGFDKQCGRKCYMDETYFFIQARLLMMCNELPPCAPADATDISDEVYITRRVRQVV